MFFVVACSGSHQVIHHIYHRFLLIWFRINYWGGSCRHNLLSLLSFILRSLIVLLHLIDLIHEVHAVLFLDLWRLLSGLLLWYCISNGFWFASNDLLLSNERLEHRIILIVVWHF